MSEEVQSPVAGVEPNMLDELLSRDPMGYSDADIERIVLELRARRDKWLAEDAAPKPERAKKAPKAKMSPEEITNLLSDIL